MTFFNKDFPCESKNQVQNWPAHRESVIGIAIATPDTMILLPTLVAVMAVAFGFYVLCHFLMRMAYHVLDIGGVVDRG